MTAPSTYRHVVAALSAGDRVRFNTSPGADDRAATAWLTVEYVGATGRRATLCDGTGRRWRLRSGAGGELEVWRERDVEQSGHYDRYGVVETIEVVAEGGGRP